MIVRSASAWNRLTYEDQLPVSDFASLFCYMLSMDNAMDNAVDNAMDNPWMLWEPFAAKTVGFPLDPSTPS